MERNKERSGDIIIKVIKWTQNEIGREPRIGSHVTNEIKSNNDKKKIMKQFNLDEFKKNPNRKVVTRDGRSVRIICTDAKGDYPVVALAIDDDGSEYMIRSTQYGISGFTEDDLFLSDEQSGKIIKEGWVGIYRSKISKTLYIPSIFIYDSEKKIEKYAELHPDEFVGMAKVTWEE